MARTNKQTKIRRSVSVFEWKVSTRDEDRQPGPVTTYMLSREEIDKIFENIKPEGKAPILYEEWGR